ncbi:hypothetical protein M427DRAFT_45149 [Gonapodya prolifera JEL478]|uniref:Uncharacterized protein n=1 Tax=Gonapodya prolifera (strain JEL478) TaxID=1344416 RepID=A0A139AC29_GONPJ|nr:hypothetical protein M427DRAFT_45149 [Gonapodya prolifera JEL478]|eukprot:KXS14330.1 hypothetical protein M427DRAFT_45149 [Gonapodya prolifera JEL478]
MAASFVIQIAWYGNRIFFSWLHKVGTPQTIQLFIVGAVVSSCYEFGMATFGPNLVDFGTKFDEFSLSVSAALTAYASVLVLCSRSIQPDTKQLSQQIHAFVACAIDATIVRQGTLIHTLRSQDAPFGTWISGLIKEQLFCFVWTLFMVGSASLFIVRRTPAAEVNGFSRREVPLVPSVVRGGPWNYFREYFLLSVAMPLSVDILSCVYMTIMQAWWYPGSLKIKPPDPSKPFQIPARHTVMIMFSMIFHLFFDVSVLHTLIAHETWRALWVFLFAQTLAELPKVALFYHVMRYFVRRAHKNESRAASKGNSKVVEKTGGPNQRRNSFAGVNSLGVGISGVLPDHQTDSTQIDSDYSNGPGQTCLQTQEILSMRASRSLSFDGSWVENGLDNPKPSGNALHRAKALLWTAIIRFFKLPGQHKISKQDVLRLRGEFSVLFLMPRLVKESRLLRSQNHMAVILSSILAIFCSVYYTPLYTSMEARKGSLVGTDLAELVMKGVVGAVVQICSRYIISAWMLRPKFRHGLIDGHDIIPGSTTSSFSTSNWAFYWRHPSSYFWVVGIAMMSLGFMTCGHILAVSVLPDIVASGH